jgi:hypothetical protein
METTELTIKGFPANELKYLKLAAKKLNVAFDELAKDAIINTILQLEDDWIEEQILEEDSVYIAQRVDQGQEEIFAFDEIQEELLA